MKYLAFKVTNILSSTKRLGYTSKLYFYNRAINNKSNIKSIRDFCISSIETFMKENYVLSYDCKEFIADTRDINKNFKEFTPIEPTRDKEDVSKVDRSNFIPIGNYRDISDDDD